jgi:hypothetical protein
MRVLAIFCDPRFVRVPILFGDAIYFISVRCFCSSIILVYLFILHLKKYYISFFAGTIILTKVS